MAAKSLLTSMKVLVYFDSALDLLLAYDAPAYGFGPVLSNKMTDSSSLLLPHVSFLRLSKGTPKLINMCLLLGVKFFHQYLYGRKFKLH